MPFSPIFALAAKKSKPVFGSFFCVVFVMAKAGREKIKLESTAGTGHFYTTTKNKRTTPEKIEIIKFDPKARKHVPYKETKIK